MPFRRLANRKGLHEIPERGGSAALAAVEIHFLYDATRGIQDSKEALSKAFPRPPQTVCKNSTWYQPIAARSVQSLFGVGGMNRLRTAPGLTSEKGGAMDIRHQHPATIPLWVDLSLLLILATTIGFLLW